MISKWTIFSFVYLDFVRIRIRIQIQIIIRCFTTFNVFVTEKSGRKINDIYISGYKMEMHWLVAN